MEKNERDYDIPERSPFSESDFKERNSPRTNSPYTMNSILE
jgi:hypothetical protein